VDGQHAAGRAVPGERGEGRAEGGDGVLRDADDLEGPLSLGGGGGEGLAGVAVEEAAVLAAAVEVERAAGRADGVGGHDVLPAAGVVEARGGAAAGAGGLGGAGAFAVGLVVGGVDGGVLHLHDDEEVADGDGVAGGAGGARADGHGGRAGGDGAAA